MCSLRYCVSGITVSSSSTTTTAAASKSTATSVRTIATSATYVSPAAPTVYGTTSECYEWYERRL
ncbi:hypothetical protein BX600DRAFT_459189 [Xylariales sp. PMI_506]|nr:hypothetical protein BX600DRAFT_459189 [Xylariales sp. PMI_506]